MAFPDSVVTDAWKRSGGRCECRRTTHGHSIPHGAGLTWSARGSEGPGGWEAYHVNSNGPDTLSNCEILCQPCHKVTGSYGG